MRERVLMAALGCFGCIAIAQAQSTPEDRMRQTFQLVKHHAENHYPAITHAKELPDGVVIGLIVNRDLEVLDHSVAFDKPVEGTTTTDEVRKMFPGKRIAERTGGGVCFGGGKSKEPKWCVVFAELEK